MRSVPSKRSSPPVSWLPHRGGPSDATRALFPAGAASVHLAAGRAQQQAVEPVEILVARSGSRSARAARLVWIATFAPSARDSVFSAAATLGSRAAPSCGADRADRVRAPDPLLGLAHRPLRRRGLPGQPDCQLAVLEAGQRPAMAHLQRAVVEQLLDLVGQLEQAQKFATELRGLPTRSATSAWVSPNSRISVRKRAPSRAARGRRAAGSRPARSRASGRRSACAP